MRRFSRAIRVAGVVFLVSLVAATDTNAACGDLNFSDSVSSTDALICLQGTVGTVSLVDRCAPEPGCTAGDPSCGDVNGDGNASATDCLMILGAGVGTVDLSGKCACEGGDPCAGVEPVAGTAIRSTFFLEGLDKPVYLASPPGDLRRIMIAEQSGVVRLALDGVLQPTPFLDIRSQVQFVDCCEEEAGFLGFAFDPEYATNGRVFVYYTAISFGGDVVVSRFKKTQGVNALDPASEQVLFRVPQDDPYHNGGLLKFGPDGYLWIGTGDGNGNIGGDPAGHAQRNSDLQGKILRVDVAVDSAPYWAVPPDNPETLPVLRSLVWAKGFRNPWRFSFDRETGDLYIGDVGQDQREEIDFIPAGSAGGSNFGWNVFEGTRCFAGGCPSPSAFEAPIYEYSHGSGPGVSVTGGYVYRGCALPDLHGTYFFGDFVRGTIQTFKVSSGAAGPVTDRTAALEPAGFREIDQISSFGEDARGEIYVVDYLDGEIYRIDPQ
jgi:glucose/arabinose dehydrogenase